MIEKIFLASGNLGKLAEFLALSQSVSQSEAHVGSQSSSQSAWESASGSASQSRSQSEAQSRSESGPESEPESRSRSASGSGHPAAPRPHLALLPNFTSLPAFDESAPTFAEIAAGKALHYSRFVDDVILADDSGLVVPALDGRPGVRSARYAGANATDAQRNEKLLSEMRTFSAERRHAYFVCALALAQHGRAIAIVTAKADGEILPSPRGHNGFGYDPIFYLRTLDKTFAELPPHQKNALSHRAQAFARVAAGLQTRAFDFRL